MKVRENACVKYTYDSIVTEVPMEFKGKNILFAIVAWFCYRQAPN